MRKKNITSELCKRFLIEKSNYQWFIEKYFGLGLFLKLIEEAEQDEEDKLRSDLERIWFELPDSIFNLRVCPRGWSMFVDLLEE